MKFFVSTAFLFIICHPLPAQIDSIPITKEIDYITDVAINLRGGHRTGIVWMGQLNAVLEVPLNYPGRWGNSIFHFHFLATHGTSFSSLVGDLQVASNIEAPGLATIFELWYQHHFNRHRFKVGLIDLNAEFLFSDWALSLINSSFGIQPTLSANIPVSIFPVSALGMLWNYDISEWLKSITGLFDGEPNIGSGYQVFPDLNLGLNEGFFIIQEFNAMLGPPSTQSSIKLGAWLHTGNFLSHDQGNYEKDFGLYLILDRPLASLGKGTLLGWVKSGVAPKDCNRIRHFQGGGLTYQDPFGASDQDNISLAFASAFFCKEFRDDLLLTYHETAIELSLRKQWNLLTVQPDIQYILNPGGIDHLNNPLCLILRIQLSI